ncbi:MAG: trypsin-like peptidase domain-containing protein [Candidatus Saccharimonas sp.]|nr:trypsin-like peptidase domain-containing protein [Planctomycetaceae bacterium]
MLFVRDNKFDASQVTILGPEAEELVGKLNAAADKLLPLLPLIGRIDVVNFPGNDFVGTGWFVAEDVVVTNRHVASLVAKWDGRQFAFTRGIGGRTIESSLCNAHEFDDPAPTADRVFKITQVLYIEPESGPNDIAFVRVERRAGGATPQFIPIASSDVGNDVPVCVIGYPARATRRVIPDQALMEQLYRGRYDVKRAAPGLGMGTRGGLTEHDCTTLGGNSGSVVVDLQGRAVGLHFAGLYEEANYAVRATTLAAYVSGRRWNQPIIVGETRSPTSPQPGLAIALPNGSVTVTVPLTLTISLGTPVVGSGVPAGSGGAGAPPKVAQVEEAVRAFWESRPEDVLAARVGFDDDNGRVGDRPFVAASVRPDRLAIVQAAGPTAVHGVPVRYFPADVDEQVQTLLELESVDEIAYDDDARTGDAFSFEPVEEEMELELHVGPEYSWDVLKSFLDEPGEQLVASMYEFHAKHIKDAIQARLVAGAKVKLVLDQKTFEEFDGDTDEFDQQAVFEDWAQHHSFQRIVAPGGRRGVMSDSYHTKVAVRDDGVFWLSSGNWKPGSSQPLITQAQRDNAADEDLPGNREWHVVVKNPTLADRFRNHILQDFELARELGGREVPRRLLDEAVVLVPEEETVVLERRPPGRIKRPEVMTSHRVKVRPLMTPDLQGQIYSEAVLELIRSARTSLLFQIPYISMPPSPSADRGYIDELIDALTNKLTTLDDARVILRSGSKNFSSPTHAAWYFKSKGVDIATQLRVIDDHHTKGMIVDGKRVLIGSHNWSKPGVSLNRDASLIFFDEDVAAYYADAFEIDWQRANPIRPRRFVPEFAMTEAVGSARPMAFERVRLSQLQSDD